MSHSYLSNHLHCVFSTKNRIDMITPEIKKHLFPYGSNSKDRRSVVPPGLAEEGGPFPAMNRWVIPFRPSGTVL